MLTKQQRDFIRNSEIVNSRDKKYCNSCFLVAFSSYGTYKFTAYGRCLQDALESIGSYIKEKGYNGLIEEYDEANEYFNDEHFGVNGGEFYIPMPVFVEEVEY